MFSKVVTALLLTAMSAAAMAEVVVIVNPKFAAASMTEDEVAQIFLGKSTVLTPVDQAESAPIRAEFYKKVTDKEPSQVKAIWSKLVFTGKGTPPKDVGTAADVKKAVAADPKMIGYVDKASVDGSVKAVLTVK
jgi:ABC-type phosphate transport system substrate-binding protein